MTLIGDGPYNCYPDTPGCTWKISHNFNLLFQFWAQKEKEGMREKKCQRCAIFFCTLWVHFVHFYKQSLKIIHIFDTFKFSCKLHRNRPLYPACPLPPNRKLWLGNHVTWPGGQMEATTHTLRPQTCSVRLWWKLTNLVFYLKNVDEANNEEVLKNMT